MVTKLSYVFSFFLLKNPPSEKRAKKKWISRVEVVKKSV